MIDILDEMTGGEMPRGWTLTRNNALLAGGETIRFCCASEQDRGHAQYVYWVGVPRADASEYFAFILDTAVGWTYFVLPRSDLLPHADQHNQASTWQPAVRCDRARRHWWMSLDEGEKILRLTAYERAYFLPSLSRPEVRADPARFQAFFDDCPRCSGAYCLRVRDDAPNIEFSEVLPVRVRNGCREFAGPPSLVESLRDWLECTSCEARIGGSV